MKKKKKYIAPVIKELDKINAPLSFDTELAT